MCYDSAVKKNMSGVKIMDITMGTINKMGWIGNNQSVRRTNASSNGISKPQDSVDISSNNGSANSKSGYLEDGKLSFKQQACRAVSYTAAALGGVAGLAIAPFGGTALGIYAGVKGRQFINIDAFGDPGHIGADVHRKIEKKTGSEALAIIGGVAAGVPVAILSSMVLFPFLGAGLAFSFAARNFDKYFGS